MFKERNVKKLPDAYRKDKDSNNYKLLELDSQAAEELKKDIKSVYDSLDLQRASGPTLDLYGNMLGQKRGLLNDTQYRYMIYTRIGRNIVKGDYNSVMDVVVQMFNTEYGNITLDDFELKETASPCKVRLTKFPLFILVNAGFSSKQAVQMIESLLPICVTLDADNFEGTFEFAELDNELDNEKGFGNIEQTIGGYLGLLLGEDEKIPILPL